MIISTAEQNPCGFWSVLYTGWAKERERHTPGAPKLSWAGGGHNWCYMSTLGKWPFRFNAQKATQAVGVLLRAIDPSEKRDNYTRILKLLYLAERQCLTERGRSIVGDRFCALPKGPILSAVYDLIQNRGFGAQHWNSHIEKHGQLDIRLVSDPGNDLLSPYEISLLEAVAEEHAKDDVGDLIEHCHTLPEYLKNDPRKDPNGPQSIEISLADILEAVGASDREAEIRSHEKEQAGFDRMFSRTRRR
jgi:hypothetical protein